MSKEDAGSLNDVIEATLEEDESLDSEVAGEDTEDASASADDEAGERAEAEGTPESSSQDEDEEFLKANNGRAIPYTAFQKKYQKWKKREADAIAKAQEFERKLAEQATRPAGDPQTTEELKRYKEVFGNYIEASKRMPWLESALLELGQGKDPDFKALQEALGKHLTSAQPSIPPALLNKIQALEQFQQTQQTEAKVAHYTRTLDQEDVQIRSKFKDVADENFMAMVNNIAAGQASLLPDNAPESAYPNRIKIAEQVNALIKSRLEGELKKQVAPAARRAGADLGHGRGPAGQAAVKMPVPGSQEWFDYISSEEGLSDLTGGK